VTPTFRFRGVNPKGEAVSGRFVTSDLPAHTEMRYRQGWRALLVCSGDGPVPPSFADQGKVAVIEPHPETGKRTWWAERIEGTMSCRYHGEVPYEHMCRRPGESAMEFTGRVLGETRDV
jgi:hypothetical protein